MVVVPARVLLSRESRAASQDLLMANARFRGGLFSLQPNRIIV